MRALLQQQPDATLVELQQRLWTSQRIRVSLQHLWRVLQSLGLRLKKSRSTPKSQDTAAIQAGRQAWWAAVSQIDPIDWCFKTKAGRPRR